MVFFGILLTLVMIVAYWKAPADPEFTKSENTPDVSFTMEQFEPSGGMEMDMPELLGDDETYEPPAWMLALENILYYVVTIALITGLIVLVTLTVYKILKAYRNRYEKWTPEEKTESGDVTESLAPPKIVLPNFSGKRLPGSRSGNITGNGCWEVPARLRRTQTPRRKRKKMPVWLTKRPIFSTRKHATARRNVRRKMRLI